MPEPDRKYRLFHRDTVSLTLIFDLIIFVGKSSIVIVKFYLVLSVRGKRMYDKRFVYREYTNPRIWNYSTSTL